MVGIILHNQQNGDTSRFLENAHRSVYVGRLHWCLVVCLLCLPHDCVWSYPDAGSANTNNTTFDIESNVYNSTVNLFNVTSYIDYGTWNNTRESDTNITQVYNKISQRPVTTTHGVLSPITLSSSDVTEPAQQTHTPDYSYNSRSINGSSSSGNNSSTTKGMRWSEWLSNETSTTRPAYRVSAENDTSAALPSITSSSRDTADIVTSAILLYTTNTNAPDKIRNVIRTFPFTQVIPHTSIISLTSSTKTTSSMPSKRVLPHSPRSTTTLSTAMTSSVNSGVFGRWRRHYTWIIAAAISVLLILLLLVVLCVHRTNNKRYTFLNTTPAARNTPQYLYQPLSGSTLDEEYEHTFVGVSIPLLQEVSVV